MSNIKFKILLDGSYTDWMTPEEIRKHEFSECIMVETMTKAEYDRRYVGLSKGLDDAISDELKNGPKSIMGS